MLPAAAVGLLLLLTGACVRRTLGFPGYVLRSASQEKGGKTIKVSVKFVRKLNLPEW